MTRRLVAGALWWLRLDLAKGSVALAALVALGPGAQW